MIGHDIALVRAGAASLLVLEALHGACFQPGWDAVEMARLLAMPGAYGVIATQAQADSGPAPAGFLLGRAAAGEAEIISLAVLPGKRQRGIGGALLADFIQQMRAHEVTEIFLEVAVDNAAALSLYRRQGFVPAGMRKAYYTASGGDAYVMRRHDA